MDGIVFNIQRYSVNDGPGIRTLVFFKGCPLQCAWCSNPESQSKNYQMMYFKNLCSRCGACVAACPNGCILLEENNRFHDANNCTICSQCEQVCTSSALKIVGEKMKVEEVVAIAEKDYLFYLNSGGGVTLGGGEPTMQALFAAQLLKDLKRLGIHTAMETCGYTAWTVFEQLIPNLDLLLYDFKQFDPVIHERHTGKSNARVLQNLKNLLKGDIPVIIRIPVITGFNDDTATMQAMASFLNQHNHGVIERVDLLPYHKLGIGKYEALGHTYQLKSAKTPGQETLADFKHIFSNLGFTTMIEFL